MNKIVLPIFLAITKLVFSVLVFLPRGNGQLFLSFPNPHWGTQPHEVLPDSQRPCFPWPVDKQPSRLWLFSDFKSIPKGSALHVLQKENGSGMLSPVLPSTFRLVSWNMQKQNHFIEWFHNFKTLTATADLFLAQEAIWENTTADLLQQSELPQWVMGVSFYDKGNKTYNGVMTGSRAQILHSESMQTNRLEPLTKTPKAILIHQLQLANGQPLLVINLHGINFTRSKHLRNELEQLNPILLVFPGPVVVAGDFNTWNPWRKEVLQTWATQNLLVTWTPKNDNRYFKLDHLLTRYCEVMDLQILKEVQSSDHHPLQADLRCQM